MSQIQRSFPRVRTTTQSLPTHLHYLHSVTDGYWAFIIFANRPQRPALRRSTFVWAAVLIYPFFRFLIGRFRTVLSFIRQHESVSSDTFGSSTHSLLSGLRSGLHRLVVAHTGRTKAHDGYVLGLLNFCRQLCNLPSPKLTQQSPELLSQYRLSFLTLRNMALIVNKEPNDSE
jgi:hypothetical protein